jgi:hypothetical protein
MSRTWSMDEVIDHQQGVGDINPPFTADERDLARNLAAAWLYFELQQELPGRVLHGSVEWLAFDMGIYRVQKIRKEGKRCVDYEAFQALVRKQTAGTERPDRNIT